MRECSVFVMSSMIILLYHPFVSRMQDPMIRPIYELDSDSLEEVIPEIPLWVKHPDFDRVGKLWWCSFVCLCLSCFLISNIV